MPARGLAESAQVSELTSQFEEMAEPEPIKGSMPPPARTSRLQPLALTPRYLDTGPAPAALTHSVSAFRTVPRTSPPPPVLASPPKAPLVTISNPTTGSVVQKSEAATAPLGGKIVQLGAYRSRTEAEKAFSAWRREIPALLAGAADPTIVTADLGDKGIYYRIRVGGFADSRKAGGFCSEFKGGGRDCFVVP